MGEEEGKQQRSQSSSPPSKGDENGGEGFENPQGTLVIYFCLYFIFIIMMRRGSNLDSYFFLPDSVCVVESKCFHSVQLSPVHHVICRPEKIKVDGWWRFKNNESNPANNWTAPQMTW